MPTAAAGRGRRRFLTSNASGAVTLYLVSTFDLNGFAACAQKQLSCAMPRV